MNKKDYQVPLSELFEIRTEENILFSANNSGENAILDDEWDIY